jgi:hypothetical protein
VWSWGWLRSALLLLPCRHLAAAVAGATGRTVVWRVRHCRPPAARLLDYDGKRCNPLGTMPTFNGGECQGAERARNPVWT